MTLSQLKLDLKRIEAKINSGDYYQGHLTKLVNRRFTLMKEIAELEKGTEQYVRFEWPRNAGEDVYKLMKEAANNFSEELRDSWKDGIGSVTGPYADIK